MLNLKARKNLVLVESLSASSSKSRGLYIPETSHNVGTVLLCGPQVEDLRAGMKVYFGAKREQIRVGDKELIVMEESNVYAIEDPSSQNDQKAGQ